AQKSTTTGTSCERSTTSRSKSPSPTSRMGLVASGIGKETAEWRGGTQSPAPLCPWARPATWRALARLRWDFGDTVVLATHSVDPERASHAAVEMRERRLVPPVRHVLLRARPEAALDAFSQPEILAIDGVQSELEVGGPVALGLLGGGGLGN